MYSKENKNIQLQKKMDYSSYQKIELEILLDKGSLSWLAEGNNSHHSRGSHK